MKDRTRVRMPALTSASEAAPPRRRAPTMPREPAAQRAWRRVPWYAAACFAAYALAFALAVWGCYDLAGPWLAKLVAAVFASSLPGLAPLARIMVHGLGQYPPRDWQPPRRPAQPENRDAESVRAAARTAGS